VTNPVTKFTETNFVQASDSLTKMNCTYLHPRQGKTSTRSREVNMVSGCPYIILSFELEDWFSWNLSRNSCHCRILQRFNF